MNFKDLYIEDHHGDTLLYAKEVYVKIKDYDLNKRTIDFSSITLNKALFFMKKYEGEDHTNLTFLIEYFASKEPSEDPAFDISAESMKVFDSEFRYEDFNQVRKSYGMDYSHLRIANVNAEFVNFSKTENFITAKIDELSLNDQSGFTLNSLTADARYSGKQLMLDDLKIITPHSDINTNHLSMSYDDLSDFNQFSDNVHLSADLNHSKVHTKDLGYFVDFFEGLEEPVKIKGLISGTVNDLSIKGLDFSFGEETTLKGDIAVRDITDASKTHFDVLLTEINASIDDIKLIKKPPFKEGEAFEIASNIAALEYIKGSAEFTGTYNDFSATADINSGAGRVSGDLVMYYDSVSNHYQYNGVISADNFDIGLISGSSDIGKITTEIVLNSSSAIPFDIPKLSTEIHADFTKVELLGYVYQNIRVDGNYANMKFDGDIKIEDDNIDLIFNGMIDVSAKIPVFDFTAEIQKAHLYELNLDRSEKSQIVCTTVDVNGSGSNLDNFNGKIVAKEISYYLRGRDYFFDSVEVISTLDSSSHDLTVSSAFIDLSIGGSFSLAKLPDAFYALAGGILPSVFPVRDDIFLEQEDFSFFVDVKDLSLVTELFFPVLQVAPGTQLNGFYETSHQDLNLNLNADWITYKDYTMHGFYLETARFFDLYEFTVKSKKFYLNDSIHLDNFKLVSALFDDNVDAHIAWAAEDSSHAGSVMGEGYWTAKDKFHFDITPSWFKVEEEIWNIDESALLIIDSTSIQLSKIRVVNGDQIIDVNGFITEDPSTKVEYTLSQFDLANLNSLLLRDAVKLNGLITANGNLRDLYHHPVYEIEYDIEACYLNDEYLGDVWGQVKPHWDNVEMEDELDRKIKREKITALDVEGNIVKNGTYQFDYLGRYYVDGRENPMDFGFNFDNMEMNVANGFIPSGVSDIDGTMNGSVRMTGRPDSILFDGFVIFKDAAAHIDLLNTDYSFSGKVSIEHDGFYMSGIPVRDKNGQYATIWDGSFYHLNFADYSYNLQMGIPDPFCVMNTSKEFNSLYYGDAFMTGDVSISYDRYNDLEINVSAKSEKGTNIVLPLDGADEVVLPDFITFKNRSDPKEDEQPKMDLSGIKMNFDMEVTPDAQISLVFDEVVGDVMTGNGSGNISMVIDEFEQFNMYGFYEVNKGSYLFTMFDFINKPFSVRKGGTISWYGDPYNADIDLEAVYRTKASLYDIMPDGERDQYTGNTEVNCIMNLTQNLFNPDLGFAIELPRSDENAKSVLRNMISSDEELNKQVFALMVLNKFLPRTNAISSASGSALGAGVGATTSDLLSSQIGSWLDGLSDDIEIGVNAKFGDDVSEDEVAILMTKQFLNDRLEITGNFGYANSSSAGSAGQSSRLIGDVSVEYKLNTNGNFRVRAFNESNEFDPLNTTSYYTQGVGVYYKESFQNWWELRQKLTNVVRKKENDVLHYKGTGGKPGDDGYIPGDPF
ncbi:MAG: hypothetical protein ACI9J3_001192 [Parvicellaceae bacterium]|jgi:hypothetical protein